MEREEEEKEKTLLNFDSTVWSYHYTN